MPRTSAERKAAKHQQRAATMKKRAQDQAEKARIEEARQEAVAPAVQRHAVLLYKNGPVLRAARIRAGGPAFVRSSALAHLAKRSPLITAGHVVAASRLQQAWEEGGAGVGMGASNYGERTGRMTPHGFQPGAIPAGLLRQTNARDECCAAQWFTGRSWPIIRGIVVEGMDATVWASRCRPQISPQTAVDRLAEALSRLVKFYARVQRPAPASKIRAVEIYAHAKNTENTSPKPAQAVDLNENPA